MGNWNTHYGSIDTFNHGNLLIMGREIVLYGSLQQIKIFNILLEEEAYPDLNKAPWEGFELKVLEYFALNPDVETLPQLMWKEILDNNLSEND